MLAIAGPTLPVPVYDKYNPFRQYNWQYQPQKPPSPKPVVTNDVQLPNAFDWFKQEKNEKSSHEEKRRKGAEKAKEAENGEPPVKKSKKSEKRGQNKKRKHTGLV